MCGLFGAIGPTIQAQFIRKVAQQAGRRGPQAWGVALRTRYGIAIHTHPGQLTGAVVPALMTPDVTAFIGQARLCTSGDYHASSNNQPLVSGHGQETVAIAHNGVVYNVDELAQQYGLELLTGNDSEVIAHLIARDTGGSLLLRVIDAVEAVDSRSPLALLVLFIYGVVTIRRGHPLYVLTEGADHYFCSRPFHPDATMLPDNAATFWTTTPDFHPSLSLREEVAL